jgi:hypothetical protein
LDSKTLKDSAPSGTEGSVTEVSGTPESACGELISPRVFRVALLAILGYFGLRLLFYAFRISPYVPPDEVTHLGMCRAFARVLLLPANSPETYQYGLVTNIPWLYYWIMGKLLALNFLGIPDLIFLRLCNIPLAFGTVYLVRRTLRLLTEDRLIQLLLTVALTNTIMFTFLSAFVSYDNLLNLLAALSVYYLFSFLRTRSGNDLALCFLSQLAGCLTKTTFLPLVLLLVFVLLLNEFTQPGRFARGLGGYLRAPGRRGMILFSGCLLGLALNLQLYGGNYLTYGSLAPEMPQVLSPELALQNRIAARDQIFTDYKQGRLSKEKALELTGRIKHPGDREDAVALIEDYAKVLKRGNPPLGPLAYIEVWVVNMLASIYGIKCHLGMLTDFPELWPFVVLMVLSLCGFLARWRPGEGGRLQGYLAVVGGCYALFLMYAIGYRMYLFYRAPGLAVQGRYIFPVIGPIYILGSYYLARLFRDEQVRLCVCLAAMLLFVLYDFPWFLLHATPEWYSGAAG